LKNSVGMIIQARMGSKRLPGKSMLDLAGEPLVGRILERVKRCQELDEIILAIPNTVSNNILEELGRKYSVKVFRGSEENLLERYYYAATYYKIKTIVRLPADNPTPEPKEIDKIIKHHLSKNPYGFSSNLCEISQSGYPDGIGAEVFSTFLLSELIRGKRKYISKEHIHMNFIDYEKSEAIDPNSCPISTIKCPQSYARPDLILDVNTIEQYYYMKNLYEELYPISNKFTIEDIIKWNDNCKI